MSSAKLALTVSKILSRLVTLSGPNGRRIVGYVDEGPESDWNERFVVLAPRYGETKKNNLQLAYMLVANGFKVLRFDQTNHIGESDGTMDQFTLENVSKDIISVVDYVDRYFEPAEIILMTLSLSGRCGLRACAEESRITRFVSLAGMVNMDRTLKAIYNRDFFGELANGASWTKVDILGFEIDGARFYRSLIDSHMLDLTGTLADASKISIPVLHLCAENDYWVTHDEVEQVIQRCPNGRYEVVPAVGHEINENPVALAHAITRIIAFCREGLDRNFTINAYPDKKTLLKQNKLERAKLQATLNFTESEDAFWGDYLGKFGIIESAGFYAEYFRTLADLLGLIRSKDILLDAGCGNGFHGISIVRSILQKVRAQGAVPNAVHYCGIDLTPQGLERSYSRHVEELISVQQELFEQDGMLGFSYRKLNFDDIAGKSAKRLPFADGSVDKICCSLVLSYLKKPIRLVRELRRVLKPGGIAVISSMKPGCDLTVLYHGFVTQGEKVEGEKDASKLLSAAGKIKQKKDSGVYNFFDIEELEGLVMRAGFKNVKCVRSLGNQANVVRVVR